MTNISVLMFDETFHGYYIHGRSPYGQAEISTEKLQKAIKNIEVRRARQTQRIDALKQTIAKEREVNHGLRETLRQNRAQVLISGT